MNFTGSQPLYALGQTSLKTALRFEKGEYRVLLKALLPEKQLSVLSLKVGDEMAFNRLALLSSDKPILDWFVSPKITISQPKRFITPLRMIYMRIIHTIFGKIHRIAIHTIF